MLCKAQKSNTVINDAVYFDIYGAEVTNLKNAKSFQIIKRDSLVEYKAVLKSYFVNGKLKTEAGLINDASFASKDRAGRLQSFVMDKDEKTKWMLDGKYKEWYENGQLKVDIDYKDGLFVGRLTTYWENGKIKRREVYNEKGVKTNAECFSRDGLLTNYTPFFKVGNINCGEYSSFETFLSENIKYPLSLNDSKENGIVLLYSYFDKRGKMFKHIVRYGLHPELNQEAIRVVNKLKNNLTPAERDGETIPYVYLLPIRFSLPKYSVDILENANPKDSIYYDKYGFILKTGTDAVSIEQIIPVENNTDLLFRRVFNKSRNIQSECTIDKLLTISNIKTKYNNLNSNTSIPTKSLINMNQVLSGKSFLWQDNGNLKSKLNYLNDKLDGQQYYFDEKGAISQRAVFKNGKLIDGNIPKEKPKDYVYSVIEKMPQFPGGESELLNYINRNVKYPISAQEAGISGKVIVRFVVGDDGSIGTVDVLRSVQSDMDNEAVRVIKSLPRFTPGMQNGQNVAVWYTLPITFKLETNTIIDQTSPFQQRFPR
jgi:TonB family protein